MAQDKNSFDFSQSFGDSQPEGPNNTPTESQFIRPGTPKIISWVIKLSGGLIKNEKQAGRVVMALAIILIIVSLVLAFTKGRGPSSSSDYFDDTFEEAGLE